MGLFFQTFGLEPLTCCGTSIGRSRFFVSCTSCSDKPATVVAVRCGHVCWCVPCALRSLRLSGGRCTYCATDPHPVLAHDGQSANGTVICDMTPHLSAKGEPSLCNVCLER